MLDVASHFFGIGQVERYMDEIAQFKINYLQMHLSDDQGWRIAINGWPELTTRGGSTEVGGGAGGYYTQADQDPCTPARHTTETPRYARRVRPRVLPPRRAPWR